MRSGEVEVVGLVMELVYHGHPQAHVRLDLLLVLSVQQDRRNLWSKEVQKGFLGKVELR